MSEIKISSLSALVKHLKNAGLQATAEAYETLLIPTKYLAASIESAKQTKDFATTNLKFIKIEGFTIKFDADLEEPLAESKSIEVSLFKADINGKPISWARITAAV